jgi:esterase/lipase superfamily enzyme
MRTTSRTFWQYVLLLVLCGGPSLALSACASRPETGAFVSTTAEAPEAKLHTILVATTRSRDARPGTLFNGERTSSLDFASVKLSVPPNHVSGAIEWPAHRPGDPRSEFVVRDSSYLDDDKAFVATVNRELKSRPIGQRKLLVFIHGYNTLFAEGLYRFAQIVDDAGSTAVPVHFSWASRGQATDYVYDLNSATTARDALERTLRLLAASDAEQINVLAHSMGNWVTVEAFRQIMISGNVPAARKVGTILLAAPDIDIDVFKSQMRRIGKPRKPFVIILSKDDRALGLSKFIAGDKDRLGSFADHGELTALGAVVIDLTDVETEDVANHGKFAEIAEIAPQLEQVLAGGIGPGRGAGQVWREGAELAIGALSAPASILSMPIRIFANE